MGIEEIVQLPTYQVTIIPDGIMQTLQSSVKVLQTIIRKHYNVFNGKPVDMQCLHLCRRQIQKRYNASGDCVRQGQQQQQRLQYRP